LSRAMHLHNLPENYGRRTASTDPVVGAESARERDS
jgi:hypothetical protein